MRPDRVLLVLLTVALLAVGCGDGGDESPRFVTVPLSCDETFERLDRLAASWPDPATLADLQAVNADLFAAIDAVDRACEDEAFARLDRIECDYLTTVTGADEAAELFIASQQGRCGDDTDEADPDEPTATIEAGAGFSTSAADR
jgi:hypothetical protein